MNIPVLFLVFNRPFHTRQTFEALRKIKPRYLYISGDGPREGNDSDVIKCMEVRKLVSDIDWECEPKMLFNEKNLGTRVAVSNAITWFFKNVAEGIIMEDDCIADPSFYSYAAEMLERYRNDDRIMHINGTNFLKGKRINKTSSYYFSNFCHVWGWATWRRAWNHFDVDMKGFNSIDKEKFLSAISSDREVSNYWYERLEAAYSKRINAWGYQWYYAFWKNEGYAITPSMNMVSNIGFDEDGTRTTSRFNRFSKMKRYPMNKIIHPEIIIKNREADRYSSEQKFKEVFPSILVKIQFKLDLIWKKITGTNP